MIRLTILLIAGLWAVMHFADQLPEPAPRVVAEARPAPEPIRGKRPEPAHKRVSMLEKSQLVPFGSPIIVAPDNNLPPVTRTPVTRTIASRPSPAPDMAINPSQILRYVTARRVNVRLGPSTRFAVAGAVDYADAVLVLSDSTNSWVKIRVEGDGIEGFMSARFLQDTLPN